jgi:DNA-binding winged helix-turn-helix (wHTH) protein
MKKTLYFHSNAVDITPKALEILTILVEKAGRVVTKEEIIQRVWAENFVEEANLTHHISRLRKILSNRKKTSLSKHCQNAVIGLLRPFAWLSRRLFI